MRRKDAILVSVAGGNSSDHLNLGRIPREAEMVEKLKDRFPASPPFITRRLEPISTPMSP